MLRGYEGSGKLPKCCEESRNRKGNALKDEFNRRRLLTPPILGGAALPALRSRLQIIVGFSRQGTLANRRWTLAFSLLTSSPSSTPKPPETSQTSLPSCSHPDRTTNSSSARTPAPAPHTRYPATQCTQSVHQYLSPLALQSSVPRTPTHAPHIPALQTGAPSTSPAPSITSHPYPQQSHTDSCPPRASTQSSPSP